jgi:hypothetical protein
MAGSGGVDGVDGWLLLLFFLTRFFTRGHHFFTSIFTPAPAKTKH